MWQQSVASTLDTYLVIEDLSPGCQYQFRVSASNPWGISLPSDPSEFVRLPEYGEWALQGGTHTLRSPPVLCVVCSDKNRDPGPTRSTRKSLGDAQSQLLPPERVFMSSPPSRLRASLCHKGYSRFQAGPCFLSQDDFLSLSLPNGLHVLAAVCPAFPAMPAAPAASAGQPSWALQFHLQNVLEQCSWNGNAVMEAIPKCSVLQEFGVQLTPNGAVSRAHFSPRFSSPGV